MDEPLFETIRPRTRSLGRRILHYARLGSTMDEARRLALEGIESGAVVVADEQTAGRGRLDRAWFSPPGSLLATAVLRPDLRPERAGLVPVAAGVAMAEAIRILTRAPALVKWPNDVWIEGRKVGGVLVESRVGEAGFDMVLVGVGVNGNLRPDAFPVELRAEATSLSAWTRRHVCLPALLKVFVERLEPLVEALEAGEGEEVLIAARRHSAILGRRVRMDTGDGTLEGVARDFGPAGELLVETADGVKAVHAGDCRLLRPST